MTFYIASAWLNRTAVQALAKVLRSKGLRWWGAHDWTIANGGKDYDLPPPDVAGQQVALDLMAAAGADLFVLLLSRYPTCGAWAELGARLMAVDESCSPAAAHVIVPADADDHLFLYHPDVTRWNTTAAFLATGAWPNWARG